MPDLNYSASEIQVVLDMGPEHEEDFFRIVVSGCVTSKHLNVSREQLVAIQDLLACNDWHNKIRLIEEALEQMSEDDRNDAIEALRSTFDEGLYTRTTT